MERITVSDAEIWQHIQNLRALYKVSEKKLHKLQTEEAKFALRLHEYLVQNYKLIAQNTERFLEYTVMGAEIVGDIWEKRKNDPKAPKSFFNASYFLMKKNVKPGITDTGMLGFFGDEGQIAIAGYFPKADKKLLSLELKKFYTYVFCAGVWNAFCGYADTFMEHYEEEKEG